MTKFRVTSKSASRTPLYAACTYDLDDSIAVLLKKLDELDLAENTLVVFTSDNGGADGMSQEPLRGNKGCYYEGGIRVPMIARWPGHIEPGSTCATPVINVDLYPTFLSLAGSEPVADSPLDGESLLPLLGETGQLEREAVFWHFPGYLDRPVDRGRDKVFRTRPVTVIRKGDWKLHLYHEEWILDGGRDALAENSAVELYNITKDIGERVDLANEQTAVRDELLGDLLAWMEATNAQFATHRNERTQLND